MHSQQCIGLLNRLSEAASSPPIPAHYLPASPEGAVRPTGRSAAPRSKRTRPEPRCPMRMPHPTPTDHPLPFEHYRGGLTDDLGAPAGFPEMALSGPAVAQFDELVHDLYPDAARVDPPRLQQLAAWLLSLPEEQASEELDTRLQRME